MAGISIGTVLTPLCFCFYFVILCGNSALVNASIGSTCGSVAELYGKHIGVRDRVPVSPIADASLTVCSATLGYTGGRSCCTTQMEGEFLATSEEYIREHIRLHNAQLAQRITRSLNHYQEHLSASLQAAESSVSEALEKLYHIPRHVHSKALNELFTQLGQYARGGRGSDVVIEDTVVNFFTHMFPHVFQYVLIDPSRAQHLGKDFDSCLMDFHDEIKPFGKVPAQLGKRIRHAFQRARILTETLDVMVKVINFTDHVQLDADCKRAVSRLQYCSMCGGETEVKPCRGLCLNVLRGCLSKVFEISSSWDDLVIAFENLQLGLAHKKDAQEILADITANVSEALLQAMGDVPRVHGQVMSLCKEYFQSPDSPEVPLKHLPTPGAVSPSPALTGHAHSTRKDIVQLIRELEESKGFLQRLADSLCRVPVLYDQEMQSDTCWNGSAVGRYMKSVPEANMISQVKHNSEVTVTLLVDRGILLIKDTLTHMRRNLSHLLNEEKMQSDASYAELEAGEVDGAGPGSGGYSSARDAYIDDEDLTVPYGGVSGSGSGAGGFDDEGDGGADSGHKGDDGKGGHSTDTSGGHRGSTRQPTCTGPDCDRDSTRGSGGSGGKGKGTGPKDGAPTLGLSVALWAVCVTMAGVLRRAGLC